MPIRIRPVQVPDDFGRMADLFNTVNPEPVTTDKLQDWEAKWPEEGIRERTVALDDNGRVIAYADSERVPWANAGKFGCWVIVDPDYQHQGIGGELAKHVEGWALARGATLLETMIRDHLPKALEFAQRRGYEIDRHIFESTLDMATFDESRFAGVVEATEATGIRFFTMADEPGEATERKLYELNKRTAFDIPGWDQEKYPPFEQWHKWALEGPDLRPDCIIMAAAGDRVVGVTDMKPVKETGAMWTHYTGVDPEFRGRNIALALKLLAVETSRRYGAPYMRTNNDSKNVPMLTVNRKMGYVPCPGEYRMRKHVK